MFNQINLFKRRVSGVIANVLVVAGGGGGGVLGGGGGGGGVVYATNRTLLGTIPITIGGGGLGATSNAANGSSGGNSLFSDSNPITALGGGGGGSQNAGGASSGGSGGGGLGANSATTGGSATQGNSGGGTGYGNAGGNGSATLAAAGGGGAGAAGSNTSTANGGAGGNGIANTITGASVTYGGGGGGGGRNDGGGVGGTGGTGGGGNANAGNTHGTATVGTDGLGGGGGGGGYDGAFGAAKKGGRGIVIVSYPSTVPLATGGIITTSGGNQIHTFSGNASSVYSDNFGSYSLNTSLDANPPNFTLNGHQTFLVKNFNNDGAQGQSAYTSGISVYTSAGLYNPVTFSGNHAIQATISSNDTTPSSIYKGGHLGLCVTGFNAAGYENVGYGLDLRVFDGMTIYRMDAGSPYHVVAGPTAITPTSWTNYTMKFEKVGNVFNGYLNGVLIVTGTDSTYQSGKAEIGGSYDCAGYYTNVVISNDGAFTVL